MGWEFVPLCVDDASRLAYVEILEDEKGNSAAAFLRRAVAWFQQMGVPVQRVMTDHGSCYISRAFAQVCRSLSLRHLRTRPYRPQTYGKAERYVQTLLSQRPYRFPDHSSQQRVARLMGEFSDGFLRRWCMNRNWPATNPTHRSITYQERTTMAYRARPSG